MEDSTYFHLLLGFIIGVSTCGLHLPAVNHKYMMIPNKVRQDHSYYRFLSAGFVHANWLHLGFNMIVLYAFGQPLVVSTCGAGEHNTSIFGQLYGTWGSLYFIALFVCGVVFANIPGYFRHRKNPSFATLGASGGVAAVLFAYILLFPLNKLYLFFVPIGIPGFLFGAFYLLLSHYQSKRSGDNVNHQAHLWGGFFGLGFMLVTQPFLAGQFLTQINDWWQQW